MKTMKKCFILLGATLGLFALASCQKEVEVNVPEKNANKHIPFILKAGLPETKTTIDADTWEMSWADNDVIYAVTTDEEWGKAYADDNDGETIANFTYSDGSFTPDLEISDGSHTFNFLYTANESQRSFHRGKATSFSLAASQTMDASAPTASLKLNDALAGQITTTTPTTFVNVPMDHLFTLMKVTLKNKTGGAIAVNKFEIKADDGVLAGIFNVVFGATPSISLKQSEKDYISVDITNGTIAADGELPVFFVMAPLSNYSGDITFTVSDTDGNTYTKTNSVSGVSFNPGEYNTASYSLKNADPVECVELDWTYPTEGAATSAGISAIPGVTVSGLGSDYAASHSPYCIKFDNTDDYIQVRTDKAIGTVSVKYKMIGGANTSQLEIYESVNGVSWTKVEDLTISGAYNSTGEVMTSEDFSSESRFVKINFKKGSNVGLGGITIKKLNTDPVIYVDNISGVSAVGGTGTLAYTVKNFTDDVTVAEVTGCVSEASASNGTISYSIAPNYTSSAANGTIVLVSASNNEITKTINVGQLRSSLTVTPSEVIIPYNKETATFTITSPEFGWTISSNNEDVLFDDAGTASASAATVNVMSDVDATDEVQTIAILTVIRNNNTNDPQKKQVVIKKDRIPAAGEVTYTLTFSAETNSASVQNYTTNWSATCNGFTWNLANWNNNQNKWNYVKAGRKNYASIATIVTDSVIPEAIKTVTVTIDAVTASMINSLKLYVSSLASFDGAAEYSFTVAVGDQPVTITAPAKDCYYKIVADCASGSSNGLITVSKVVYSNQ